MPKFDDNKCKTHLKLSIHRMNLLKNKKQNAIQMGERDIAQLLKSDKTELARIKVESLIREDMIIQAFEILELFIELLHTRMAMLKMQKTVPFDLKEAVCTIIYAAPRLDIPELHEVRKQFIYKYGEGFSNDAMENRGNCVNPKIVHKLSACTPENYLVFDYLGNIAKKYNVDWCCPYENEQHQPLIDNSTFMIPPSIHQPPLIPFQPNFNNDNNQNQRFIPSGGQSVLPGTGYNPNPSPQSNFDFPSVPSNNNVHQNNFSNNNFPSVPSNNNGHQNSSNFNFPSVPSNNNYSQQPPNYSPTPKNDEISFDFPSVPNGNNQSNGSNNNDDLDDLSSRFNRLKKK
eukprot:TRINITY_DN3741_c0_g1_i1.p1 TRINITY_DN3741_c0_g1~~TRINITY_DN3741_c0_g1_i1.p1  ORF type:complete len:344 (-),score=96.54 TRINITY_DN3741_c0_g1_i1:611-1642(-)